jgi:hypothetical protein
MPYPKKHKRAGAGPTLCQNLQKAWRLYTAGLRRNQVRIPAHNAIQPKDFRAYRQTGQPHRSAARYSSDIQSNGLKRGHRRKRLHCLTFPIPGTPPQDTVFGTVICQIQQNADLAIFHQRIKPVSRDMLQTQPCPDPP